MDYIAELGRKCDATARTRREALAAAYATTVPYERALLTLLQFADGLFPTGGFAHSFGLETYVQDGRVRDRQSLEAFVAAHLEGSAGPADAVAAAIAVRLSARAAVDDWVALDLRLDAMKSVPEFRAASRQMGRQTLRIAAGLGADPFLARLAGAVDDARACGHHASVFGAVGLGQVVRWLQRISYERPAART